jgi:hypothetical protein
MSHEEYDGDDGSAKTFATESPYKYGEPVNLHRAKAKRAAKHGISYVLPQDTRDASPTFRREASFQGLKQKFEKISLSAIQRQRDLSRDFRCDSEQDLPAQCAEKVVTRALDPPVIHTKTIGKRNTESSMQSAKTQVVSNKRISMTLDQQDELLASVLESTSGCVFTEGELQSRILMKSVAKSMESLQPRVTANDRDTDSEGKEFLSTLSKEVAAATSRFPKDQDELVIFLGEEFEAAMCGHPQLPQNLGLYTYDFNVDKRGGNGSTSTRRLVAIKEGGTVEDMLESLETGYEVSLMGCGGMPQVK